MSGRYDLPAPIPVDTDVRSYLAWREQLRIMERADLAAREEAFRLCPECRAGEHRNPPHGSVLCQCGDRRCNCIIAGFR